MGRVFISLNAICKGISAFTIARFRSNGKFSIWRLTQAEVVNDNGQKLPKVPRRIARVFTNIIVFTSWRWCAFEVMVQVSMKIDASRSSYDNGRKLPKVPRRIARVFTNIIVFTSWRWCAFEVMVQVSMKIDASRSSYDNGRKLPKVPRRIARVFTNIIVFTSWR